MARLCEPMKLSDLAGKGIVFNVDSNYVEENESDDEGTRENIDKYSNKECAGVFDEDIYEDGEPFEIIATRMENLLSGGKLKKRILRQGDGETPRDYDTVKIEYNAYLEYNDEPFDSTYIRKKPFKFVVNDGRVLVGLDLAVQSMKCNEKSQFLIEPEYAYGKNCLVGRIPNNSTVLFEVELIDVIKSGAATTFEQLSEEQQNTFPEVYKYAMALNEKGKECVRQQNLKNAIKNYNIAACSLERVLLSNTDEGEKHRDLLMKLYSNLLVCYTRMDLPKKGCIVAKKIYAVTENGELMKLPAKVYFNHAKCLRILGEYGQAKDFLDQARKIEPKNLDICNELLNIENDKTKHEGEQMTFAKAFVDTLGK